MFTPLGSCVISLLHSILHNDIVQHILEYHPSPLNVHRLMNEMEEHDDCGGYVTYYIDNQDRLVQVFDPDPDGSHYDYYVNETKEMTEEEFHQEYQYRECVVYAVKDDDGGIMDSVYGNFRVERDDLDGN